MSNTIEADQLYDNSQVVKTYKPSIREVIQYKVIKLVEDDPHSINDFINTHINELQNDELNILYQCVSYWDDYDC